MPIEFSCECGKRLKVSDEFADQTVKCPECGAVQTAPGGITSVRPEQPLRREPDDASSKRSRPLDEDDEPRRPRRYERDDEDDDRGERPVPRTSRKAVASLVLGLLALPCAIFAGIPAIIFGILGLTEISRSKGRLSGTGMAWTGIVLGGILMVVGSIAVLAGLLLPAIQKVREAASRANHTNDLYELGLAIHAYAAEHQDQLPDHVRGPSGAPLLSWRVELLPYLGEGALYSQFNLKEPWDSPTNKPLIARMPRVFGAPKGYEETLPQGHTVYRVFGGRGLFLNGRPPKFGGIIDGPSNTIFFVEAGESVPWTQPEELPFDGQSPLPKLGSFSKQRFGALFCDGAVRWFTPGKYSERDMRASITPNGKEAVALP